MKRFSWHFYLSAGLLVSSGLLYCLQIWFFHRSQETFFYMLQDFAFVPVQVLLVTLIINSIMQNRERLALQRKMNMVIGAFFSEMGDDLLKKLSDFDAHSDAVASSLRIRGDWGEREFAAAMKFAKGHEYALQCKQSSLPDLKNFLLENRRFLLTLLENPNLLEHETFTDLLWAVCHLTEELWHREELTRLPKTDFAHLEGDMERAYALLISQWLLYIKHLKDDYPYIFSLVLRTSPFNPEASAVVEA